MHNPADEILLSAYVDNELTAEERARVDQLLAASAEARQTVDELRAVRARLKELPAYTLGPQFANQVLAQARRDNADVREPGVIPSPGFWTTWRGLAWAALTLAAALMILITNRPIGQGERKVAQAPRQADEERRAAPPPPQLAKELASDNAAPVAVDKLEADRVVESPPSATPQPSPAPAGGFGAGGAGSAERSGSLARSAKRSDDLQDAPTPTTNAPAENLLVVQVDYANRTAGPQTFQTVLARHRIDVSPASPDGLDDNVFYVEASSEQVYAVLDDLKSSVGEFPSVQVADRQDGAAVENERAARAKSMTLGRAYPLRSRSVTDDSYSFTRGQPAAPGSGGAGVELKALAESSTAAAGAEPLRVEDRSSLALTAPKSPVRAVFVLRAATGQTPGAAGAAPAGR